MKGTRTLLSLAVGLALASPSVYAADFVCPADSELTPIPVIQGIADKSPLIPADKFESTQSIVVKAVVSALSSGVNKGFYLLDTNGDGNEQTSDGIFVFPGDDNFLSKNPQIQPGAQVCLEAKVAEYYGFTQLKLDKTAPKIKVMAQTQSPSATLFRVLDNENLSRALERHEGMRIRLDADSELKISRNFSYDGYRNTVMLSHKEPLIKPTQLYIANSREAKALAKSNNNNRVVVESDMPAAQGKLPWLPEWEPEMGYLRIGDAPINLEATVNYSFGAYRLIVPSEQRISLADIIRITENDRQQTAPARAQVSNLRIGSFNVLNYFTSHSSIGGALNILCKDQADADNAKGCNRGAKSQPEFEKQRTKIANAITEMDADLLGLMEMENNGFADNSALHNLVTRLNEQQQDASKHYAYVRLPVSTLTDGKFFGGDAIMVAMIYRPALLTPSGDASVIKLPEQRYTTGGVAKTAGQRDSLVQTFTVAKSKEPLTLVVNHLKSKGSGCYENGDGKTEPADLQGKCTEFRVSAAKVLGEAVSKLPGQVLLVGDLNSYAKEDPIRVLTDYNPATSERKIVSASHTFIGDQSYEQLGREVTRSYGLIDLNVKFNKEKAISYSYDGELGTLDYALANPALASKVAGVADWHINSFESSLFEYSSQYTGTLLKSDNPFSASDHDPIIVDLKWESYADKPDNSSGGGALGLGLLALLPLAWRRSRR
ncbi:ExeM/NucH family extracellular endonuclease [Aeromonas sobria]|uniref:ExeM/NucH family extracellular endonuclease n=1 Tax=Aeromonas sobria TaxID=646 RepID=UPI00111BAC5A|nr:ExeM/NucH family extracellular endonuclease [Aeromonas sobria]TNI82928.1 nuclease [Aeromonas sobria]